MDRRAVAPARRGGKAPPWSSFVAGTYYKDGERHFWDVRHPDRAIAIELDGAAFDRLFVEVADPDDAIRTLAPVRD